MPVVNPLLEHARRYANDYGWAVVPVRGKEPACKWRRFIRQKPTRKQHGGLFGIRGVTGLAVIAGEVSDKLRVRDFDQFDAYGRWAEGHRGLADSLPTARTARGYHVYFRADTADACVDFDDGELRAGKCVVVLPPSPHPDGGLYCWTVPPGERVPLLCDLEGSGLLGPAPPLAAVPVTVPPAVQEAITLTLPGKAGQRHKLIFQFARRLKAVDGLGVSDSALRSYITEWHRQATPFIRTKALHSTETDFYDAWEGALVPLGDDQFWNIIRTHLAEPEPDWFFDWCFPSLGKRVLRVCMALQLHAGSEPFFLSARKAGEAVGLEGKDANRHLNKLAKQGFIKLVEKGTYASGMASTWLYVGRQG